MALEDPQTVVSGTPETNTTQSSPAPEPVVTTELPTTGGDQAPSGIPAPDTVSPPAEEAAASAEPPAAVPEPQNKPSLLGGEHPTETPTEGEADAKAETDKGEAPPEGEAVAYEAFKLPEGAVVDPERMGEFTKLAGTARLTQEQAQSFVDMYAAEMTRFQTSTTQQNFDAFHRQRDDWRARFEKDPEIGGARIQTTVNEIVGLRNHFATDAKHLKELSEALDLTGAGDHPAVLRWFANAARGFAELTRESEGVFTGEPAPQQGQGNRYQRRYPNSRRQ